MIAEDIAGIMAIIPKEIMLNAASKPHVSGINERSFECVEDTNSPFCFKKGVDAGAGESEWIVAKDLDKWNKIFNDLNPIDGKVTGAGKFYYDMTLKS